MNALNFPLKTILLSFFVIAVSVSFSQNSCTQKLEHAEELYEVGQIDKVAPLLEDCIENGFSKEERVRAYRLLTLCNLYYNENKKAIRSMEKLLRTNPEYKISEFDPSEFISMHNTFRTKPVFITGIKSSFGGIHFYSVDNYNDINSMESYGVYTPGVSYSAGLSFESPIITELSVVYEFYYKSYGYSYEDMILDYAEITFQEQITGIEVPVLLQWNILKKDIVPYINAGVSFDYLLSSAGRFERRDRIGEEYREPVTLDLDLADSRTPLNYAFTAGAGVRWKNFLGRGYLTLDVRYSRYFESLVNPASRADHPEMVYSFLTTDNALRIENTQIMLGYKMPIYFARYKGKRK